jgi:hypothetical protein
MEASISFLLSSPVLMVSQIAFNVLQHWCSASLQTPQKWMVPNPSGLGDTVVVCWQQFWEECSLWRHILEIPM